MLGARGRHGGQVYSRSGAAWPAARHTAVAPPGSVSQLGLTGVSPGEAGWSLASASIQPGHQPSEDLAGDLQRLFTGLNISLLALAFIPCWPGQDPNPSACFPVALSPALPGSANAPLPFLPHPHHNFSCPIQETWLLLGLTPSGRGEITVVGAGCVSCPVCSHPC